MLVKGGEIMLLQNKEYRRKVTSVLFDVIKRENQVLTNKEIYSLVSKELNLTEEDKSRRYERSGIYVYQNMVQWGLLELKVIGYIKQESRGEWVITPKGSNSQIDEDYSKFQKKYWNEKLANKRKGVNKENSLPLFNKATNLKFKDKGNKYGLLAEILEQNRRILDILEKEK